MTYLRNTWYLAAWSSELPSDQLLARTLLDQPVVMFRDPNGEPRAMGPQAEILANEHVQVLRGPFEHEDKPMIEAVARRMNGADLWDLDPVMLPGDGAAVQARRLLREMVDKEAALTDSVTAE